MALKFGPQWLRDLSDGGTSSSQPSTPPASVKFKLADYRYGREEMLALFNDQSTPPDQVRKHLSIFSKEIQKPITMLPLTEDEQRLISQGFNSTVVLRAASRGAGPPLRTGRGGGTSDRGRGRGRGRGEGYRGENGEVGYSRSTQDGWEQVGRKFERTYSRGYEDIGPKREFVRSSSDNWRDKRVEDEEEEEESGSNWRNNRERWGTSTRTNWRESQRDNFDMDRRPAHPKGHEQENRGLQKSNNEIYENEGDVPEWVADDVGDDPGTFDSSGAFVSTRQGKKYIELRRDPPPSEENVKRAAITQVNVDKTKSCDFSKNSTENLHPAPNNKAAYIPPNARNGTGDSNETQETAGQQQPEDKQETELCIENPMSGTGYSNKGDGDSGCRLPNTEVISETRLPPGQILSFTAAPPTHPPALLGETAPPKTRMLEMDRLRLEKSLQNYVAEMTADAERRAKSVIESAQPPVPLSSEDANKWFYKDPQGEVQGPFTNDEMSQWFSAGYFTMTLIVKRGCDDAYKPLGELIKRYGRVPFLPGPPLPPLITSTITAEPNLPPAPHIAVPPLVPPLTPPMIAMTDPHLVQQMLLQREFIKQTYLRQFQQIQAPLPDPDNFKNSPEQQYLSMQMLLQANPLLMQHQLLLQQQQQQPPEHSLASSAFSGEPTPPVFQQSSSNNSSSATIVPGATEDEPVWHNTAPILPGIWPPPQQPTPPTSLWDVDVSTGTVSPAYRAQLDKLRREREEERLKEEEKAREEELQKKKEELLRQQEELERQREQMRREKEELDRQKLLEIQKIEEARRQEEERIRLEIERQQREKIEEEKRLQEMAKKQVEADRKREKELEKLEKKKRKEEEKRLEEEKRRKKVEEELRKQQELEQQQKEEKMQRELAEKEKYEAQKRLHLEYMRQQEAIRKSQQHQKEQLSNIQLPASSNWAAFQHSSPKLPSQSKSLTEIQEEEAKQEEERLREQQIQMQKFQEHMLASQSQQVLQKSWAIHNSQALPSKGLSLLHIQQQEAEKAKSEMEKTNNNTYTAKVAQSNTSTWANSAGMWGGQPPVWNALSSTTGFWDSVAAPTTKKTAVRESGEFPALKSAPSQQSKKVNPKDVKASKAKTPVAKLKKEEESVQKLFQNRQQDDFTQWVTDRIIEFSVSIDVPTFVSFIVDVESPDEIQDYMKTYLGDNKASREFAKKFIEKRNKFRNQARLVKQQEEDSIWGPAPAINPHNQVRGNTNNISTDGVTVKVKNRKKKQKMQKLDCSILGFTVQADPNRKNAAGELEVIE